MEDDRSHFIKIAVVSSITIGIELFLTIWTCIQINDLGFSYIETTQKSKEAAATFLLMFFGTFVTAAFSVILPKIGGFKSYRELHDQKYQLRSAVFLTVMYTYLLGSALGSLLNAYLLIHDAGISLFEMIRTMY